MIFPASRSPRTEGALERGSRRVTSGRRSPDSARAIARAKSAIVEEYDPRYARPPSTRFAAVTGIGSWVPSPSATTTSRPPYPRSARPRSRDSRVPTKSATTSAPSSPAISRRARAASSGAAAAVAPASRAAFRAASRGSIASTRACWARATWIAASPTPPAPTTTTVESSSASPRVATTWYAVAPLHPRVAASTGSRSGGSGSTVDCRATTNSA